MIAEFRHVGMQSRPDGFALSGQLAIVVGLEEGCVEPGVDIFPAVASAVPREMADVEWLVSFGRFGLRPRFVRVDVIMTTGEFEIVKDFGPYVGFLSLDSKGRCKCKQRKEKVFH